MASERDYSSIPGPSDPIVPLACEDSDTDDSSLKRDGSRQSLRQPYRATVTVLTVLACVGGFFVLVSVMGHDAREGNHTLGGDDEVALFGRPAIKPQKWQPPWSKKTNKGKQLAWRTRQVTLSQAPDREICNHDLDLPESDGGKVWDLPEATMNLCYRMFQDQVKLTGGHKWGRNWCWVAMKRYGCLFNLADRYTWAEAQSAAHKAAPPVPAREVNPMHPLEDEHICDGRDFGEVAEWSPSEWQDAKAWFRKHVAVYVINIESETERWQNISGHLRDLDIVPNRIPGYDLRLEKDLHRAYRDGSIPPHFNISYAEEVARSPENGMVGIRGTVGCAAAHFHAQRLATRLHQASALTLILEDDVYLSDDFIPRVWSLARKELPCDWEAVSLGSRCPYGKCLSRHLSRVWPDVNEPEWRCRHGTNYGFQGVLYRTRAIAGLQDKWKQVVYDVKRPHCLDVDVALASISDQVGFYAVPAAQFPGFLVEKQEKSVRERIDKEGRLDSALVNAVTFRGGLPNLMH